MSLLQPAKNEISRMKIGIQGAAGSGKTRTGTDIIIGCANLHRTKGKKPVVAAIDSESGMDFHIDRFKEADVELLTVKTGAFADLLEAMKEAEKVADAVIIDSASAFWEDLKWKFKVDRVTNRLKSQEWFNKQTSEKQKTEINDRAKSYVMTMYDWGPLKDTWREFSHMFLTSQMHCIICGRLAFEWDNEVDQNGKTQLVKTGTKMATEKDMGYEPSLVLEMEIVKPRDVKLNKIVKSKWIHRCTVLKDRYDLMNGKQIDNPTFEDFRPLIDKLNLDVKHVSINKPQVEKQLFTKDGSSYAREAAVNKEIAGDRIKEVLILAGINGSSEAVKKERVQTLLKAFGCSGWVEIMKLPLDDINSGLRKLKDITGTKIPERN